VVVRTLPLRLSASIAIVIAAGTVMARGQSLHEQGICAKQAERAFQDYHNAGKLGKIPGYKLLDGNYQSHYNARLSKCFVLITDFYQVKDEMRTAIELVDVFERRSFALYLSGPKLVDCELAPALNQTTFCSSRAEFDAFVTKYME
jgi:hypothetical protein